MTSKFVYIIEALGTSLFKIGFTNDVAARLDALQNDSPVCLVLRAIIQNGSRDLEHRLHQHFKMYVHHGEWFTLPQNWREMLPSLLLVKFTEELIPFVRPCPCVLENGSKKARKRREIREAARRIAAIHPQTIPLIPVALKHELQSPLDAAKEHETYVTTWAKVAQELVPLQRFESKELIH